MTSASRAAGLSAQKHDRGAEHATLREREQSLRLQPGFPQLSGSSVDGVGRRWHLVLEAFM